MSDQTALPRSEAGERNKGPILAILRNLLTAPGLVLEIGAGTGQHAVHFARHLPHLEWLPTDRGEWLDALRERVRREGPSNLRVPIELDVNSNDWPIASADAVYSANTLHIMAWPEVEAFFRGVGRTLAPRGRLAVYGPFRFRGTTPPRAMRSSTRTCGGTMPPVESATSRRSMRSPLPWVCSSRRIARCRPTTSSSSGANPPEKWPRVFPGDSERVSPVL